MTGQAPQVCIQHVAIQTANFDDAYNFYANLLELEIVKEQFRYKKRMMAWFNAGGAMIELFSVKNDEIPQAFNERHVGTIHIAFEVQDIYAIIAHLEKHGIKILKPPFLPPTNDENQPLVAFVQGPDGEEIEFRERPKTGDSDTA